MTHKNSDRFDIKWLSAFLSLPLAFGLVYFSWDWRSPELAAHRGLAATLFLAVVMVVITGLFILARRSAGESRRVRSAIKGGLALSVTALLLFCAKELHFQWMRHSVLSADPEVLSRLGRHFVVGYRNQSSLEDLIARNGISGVFVTAHNVHGLDVSTIQATLLRFQSLSRNHGGKPLWVATDQEGGGVSRMSPPLAVQPTLGELVKQYSDAQELEPLVRSYGRRQGTALAALGINLNFSPVVDVNHNIVNQEDRYTRIYQRAISADPKMVERVAGWYCDALYESGVSCTLKHFPGLGLVQTDTHLDSARLTLSTQTLSESDWIPFKGLMKPGHHPFTMLSHVQLTDVDPSNPVSTSKRVVDNLLRKEWRFDGVLITDDFSMAAITQRNGGIGKATIDALNAGVDLILISFDPDQYYPAMYDLLNAERTGKIDHVMLQRSNQRLDSLTIR